MALHLSNYDIVFLCIMVLSAVIALFRGGITELLSLSTWFIALFIMRHYQLQLDQLIPQIVSNEMLKGLIRYVIAFVGVAIIITVIKIILHRFVKNFGLSGLNYSIGFLFGLLRGIIICALIIVLLQVLHFDNKQEWKHSIMSPLLVPAVEYIVDAVPDQVKQFQQTGAAIESGINFVHQAESLVK